MTASMEILIEFNADTDQFELAVRSHGRTAPFGPRIFRAPPHPAVKATHPTLAAAEADAQKIRDYLGALRKDKSQKRKYTA